MPKFSSYKPREVVEKFKKLDFVEHHQAGSHLTMKNYTTGHRVVIPLHLKDMKKGTMLSILRESGVEKEVFLKIK